MWTPEARPLTDEEQATVARLREEQGAVQKRRSDLTAEINAEIAKAAEGLERTSDEYKKKRSAVYAKHRERLTAIGKEYKDLADRIGELVPAAQRKPFVWIYERL